MKTTLLHIQEPGLLVVFDDLTQRPVAISALRSGPVRPEAVQMRRMCSTLHRTHVDGDVLYLDAFDLIGLRGWIARQWPRLTSGTVDRRLAEWVGGVHRTALLREVDRMVEPDGSAPIGEQRLYRAVAIAQMQGGRCDRFVRINLAAVERHKSSNKLGAGSAEG